jgi:hypothetical protein
MTLKAVVLAVALLAHRGAPPSSVVDAIATACSEEAQRAPVDVAQCVSLMTLYGAKESSWRPVYGDGGRSYGYWQEPSAIATKLDALGQARYWLRVLRLSSLASVDSDAKRAAHRARLAASLLDTVTREDAADGW